MFVVEKDAIIMPKRQQQDFSELLSQLDKAAAPYNQRLAALEAKMDAILQDRVTRTDISNLRSEITNTMVPLASYRPEHAALVEKDAQLSAQITTYHTDHLASIERITTMIDTLKVSIEAKLEKAQEATLSAHDRAWMRGTQILAWVSAAISLCSLIAAVFIGHIHFS